MKYQTRLIALSLSALFLLVGCQSEKTYRQELRTWLEKPESALVAGRGAPDQFFVSNGVRYLTYNSSSLNNQKGRIACNTGSFNGFSSSTDCTQLYCKEVFQVENDRVKEVKFEGNNCF